MISVDDHVVEPPHMFDGRLPAALQERAPQIVETDEGHQVWEFDGQRFTQVGMNAVAGRRPETVQARAVPLRADAPRLLRHRRPHPRHGHQRRLGVAQLPVDDHRLLRPGVLAAPRTPSSASPCIAGVERLAVRGVVLAVPRADHPARHHLPRRPRARRRPRSAATPTRGFRSVTLPERPHAHRAAVAVRSRPLGPDHRGLRRDRHRDLACTSARRAATQLPPGAPTLQLGATLFGQLSLARVRRVAVVGLRRASIPT